MPSNIYARTKCGKHIDHDTSSQDPSTYSSLLYEPPAALTRRLEGGARRAPWPRGTLNCPEDRDLTTASVKRTHSAHAPQWNGQQRTKRALVFSQLLFVLYFLLSGRRPQKRGRRCCNRSGRRTPAESAGSARGKVVVALAHRIPGVHRWFRARSCGSQTEQHARRDSDAFWSGTARTQAESRRRH